MIKLFSSFCKIGLLSTLFTTLEFDKDGSFVLVQISYAL